VGRKRESLTRWPPSIANLRAYNPDPIKVPVNIRVIEFPLFTDAHVTGEANVGPYAFLNTVAFHGAGPVRRAVILRYALYDAAERPNISELDESQADLYHGGSPPEEIAALSSLVLGIRLRAGNVSREFDPQGDPLGRPMELWNEGEPYFRVPNSYRIPFAAKGEHALGELNELHSLTHPSELESIAIVRAARMYQDALWVAESEPSLTWLLLVSALETASNEWRRSACGAVERLREGKPTLYKYLADLEDQSILDRVAKEVAESLGVTKKFVDFVQAFRPDPPSERPPVGFQFDWKEENWKSVLKTIYGYRSKALHDGIPFPAPMCSPPLKLPDWNFTAEIPTALVESQKGGTWVRKDIPIYLHVFEYLARNVLLKWWSSCAEKVKTQI
jgi:hypothetical protein